MIKFTIIDSWELAVLIPIRRADIMGYFAILATIPGSFLSSLFVMFFLRVIAPNFGIQPVD